MAAAKNPAAGEVYTFDADHGVGPGMVLAGTEVTVTGVHDPGTPGLGLCDSPQVTADFPERGTVRTIALPIRDFVAMTTKVGA